MAKVLITETVNEAGPKLLKEAGYELVYAVGDAETIRREITEADAVFTRIFPLTPELLGTARRLRIVSKHGVGVDNIAVEWCREHGVAVTVTPDANGQSVAEHAFALMMALAKHIIPISEGYKEQGFSIKNSREGIELLGKTAGLIGLGRIGKRFANMCRGAFDMNVLAYDPYLSEAPEGVTLIDDLDKLLSEADVVSLHLVLTEETRGIISAERLARMKPGAILINCSRGPMVDESALIAALESGRLGAAGLDVTDPEPVETDSPLFKLPNVIVTPHYASTTAEAAKRVSEIGCANIIVCLSGKEPAGRVV